MSLNLNKNNWYIRLHIHVSRQRNFHINVRVRMYKHCYSNFCKRSMCLATDTPKRSGIQTKKTHLINGTITRIFDALLTSYDT